MTLTPILQRERRMVPKRTDIYADLEHGAIWSVGTKKDLIIARRSRVFGVAYRNESHLQTLHTFFGVSAAFKNAQKYFWN